MRLAVVALLAVGLASTLPPPAAAADCPAVSRRSTLDELVRRVRDERLRYVFVGERHDVGPVKRFAVELANALAAEGIDTGLYVEGFRRGCRPGDDSCWSLARAFDGDAFDELLARARVPVHPIDPPTRERRVERMAAAVAAGSETVRVVLAGKSHVVHADDPDAEWRVFGSQRYPSPGDLARSFERGDYLTVGLEEARSSRAPYELRRGACGFDYRLTTADVPGYWGAGGRTSGGGGARRAQAAPR